MITIEIDPEVFEKLGEIAIPFKETSPNLVIRRLLGMEQAQTIAEDNFAGSDFSGSETLEPPKVNAIPLSRDEVGDVGDRIRKLRDASFETHPSFLTFLMDKFYNSKGNYRNSDIIEFMKNVNLQLPNGAFRNPWMKAPYGGEKNGVVSCQRTIEHFRQTRRFGCWNGRDIKRNCDAFEECDYHPKSKTQMKNKCDLRKGVIWKRMSPEAPFCYGKYYAEVVKEEILNNFKIPLNLLLPVFYPNRVYENRLIKEFKIDFNFDDFELSSFFAT
mgnify:CR=1 FL=1